MTAETQVKAPFEQLVTVDIPQLLGGIGYRKLVASPRKRIDWVRNLGFAAPDGQWVEISQNCFDYKGFAGLIMRRQVHYPCVTVVSADEQMKSFLLNGTAEPMVSEPGVCSDVLRAITEADRNDLLQIFSSRSNAALAID